MRSGQQKNVLEQFFLQFSTSQTAKQKKTLQSHLKSQASLLSHSISGWHAEALAKSAFKES